MNKKIKYLILIGFVCSYILANSCQANTKNQNQKFNHISTTAFSNTILYPIADSGIVQQYPDNTPGSADYLTIVTSSTGWGRDALIRFDTSTLPQGGIILSAKLRLYYYDWGDTNPKDRPLNCYMITSVWDESTVTWNNQPSYAPQPTTSTPVPSSPGTWIEWDVTSDVQDFLSGTETNSFRHVKEL